MVGKSAALRCLARIGLFAVVCALLLVPAVAGAADVSFPFLGAQTQATWAIQGFSVQWALFGGLSGSDGSPLYFLALTAVLVGAMMVVFNDKFQNFTTLGPWFLLVIVMIFAPYNSRLVFTPIGAGDCSGGARATVAGKGNLTPVNLCGFTPQVVAMHVGNVISVLIYEVMKNKDMIGQVDQIINQTAIVADPMIQNVPPQAVKELAQFKNACPNVTDVGPMNAGAGGSTVPGTGATGSLGKLNSSVGDFFNAGAVGARHVAANRPAIILYNSKPSAWNDQQWMEYKNGLKVLHNSYGGGGNTREIVDTSGGESGQVPVATAVEQIIANMRANAPAEPGPGDVAYYFGKADSPETPLMSDTYLAANRSKVATSDVDMVAAYNAGMKDTSRGKIGYLTQLAGSEEGAYLNQMKTGWGVFYSESINGRMSDAWRSKDSDVFGYIPGLNGGTPKAEESANSGWFPGTTFYVRSVGVQRPTYSCEMYGHDVARSVLAQTLTRGQGTNQEDSVCWNNTIRALFDSKMSAADNLPEGYCASGSNLPGNLKQALVSEGGSKDALVNILLKPVLASAAMKGENAGVGGIANGMYGEMGTGITKLMGLSGKTGDAYNGLGGIAASIGQAFASVAGYLSGLKAVATVMVLRSLVEIAFVAVVIVTPLMFLMGVLIPSNAMGMLITVTMGVLVLRLVPATLIIIDTVVTLVMQGAVAASGGGMDEIYTRGIILYAAAGMYTGVIGLTMLIMFKMGSADNFTKLTQLDNAAEQIASTGTKVLTALMTTAGAIAASGALGAVAGSISGKGKAAGAKEFMAESAVKTLGNVNSRMATAAGGAVTDAMTPPPGVKKEDWDKLSAEEKLKHKGIYDSQAATGIDKGEWDKMSMSQREEAFKKLDESKQTEAVAAQAGKAAYLEEERKKAEASTKGLGDKEKEEKIADHMVKAEAAWSSGSVDQNKYVNEAKKTAANDIRTGATALAEGKYGPMSGFGKKLAGMGGMVDGAMATMSGAAWGGLSGLRGGWEAFGEISAIPGAKVIGEILNEGKQAPQRAAAARAMATKYAGKDVGAFKTLGLPLVSGGLRGSMESSAAKQKYFEQEVGVWGTGMAAKGTNKMQSVVSAVTKAGEAKATGTAFAASGLGNMTTADAVLKASIGANEKMASEASQMRWLRELDRHLNDTIGRGVGKLAAAAGEEKGRYSVFENVKGSYVSEAKSRAFRSVFGIKSVDDELDIGSASEDITEAVKEAKKKGSFKKALARRAKLMAPYTDGDDEMFVELVKAGVPQAVASAKRKGASFTTRKHGAHSFINPLDGFMGQGQSTINRVVREKAELANPKSRINLAALNSAFSEVLGDFVAKVGNDEIKVNDRGGGMIAMGIDAKRMQGIADSAFKKLEATMSAENKAMIAGELAAFKEIYMARIDKATTSKDGLFVFDDMKIDKTP